MAQIKFRDFVDVYDDSDKEYELHLPASLWAELTAKYPDTTSEIRIVKNEGDTVVLEDFAGSMYGFDWWEDIEDNLYAVYANGDYIEIRHEKLLEH